MSDAVVRYRGARLVAPRIGWAVSGTALLVAVSVGGLPALTSAGTVGALVRWAHTSLAVLALVALVGVGWTLLQALIHTRLGSRPMFDGDDGPAPIPLRRVARSSAAAALLMLAFDTFGGLSMLSELWLASEISASLGLSIFAEMLRYALLPSVVAGIALGTLGELVRFRLFRGRPDSLTGPVRGV